jgi:D-aminoacyl-tRNA deacylase
MRALIQRVKSAKVTIDNRTVAKIAHGLVILVGIGHDDNEENARSLAEKIATLRIFEDEQGKFNDSIMDINGSALVVSQFTLYADTRKGRRPSFTQAARPEIAEPLVNKFVHYLSTHGITTQAGVFGAHMLVELENDGPVTIFLDC